MPEMVESKKYMGEWLKVEIGCWLVGSKGRRRGSNVLRQNLRSMIIRIEELEMKQEKGTAMLLEWWWKMVWKNNLVFREYDNTMFFIWFNGKNQLSYDGEFFPSPTLNATLIDLYILAEPPHV